MLMGLGIAIGFVSGFGTTTPPDHDGIHPVAILALSGAVFYILHHIIVKANLFLIGGAVLLTRGTTNLKAVNGLAKSDPLLAILFLISSLSLAGIPVLSGFWAKYALVRGGLEAESYTIVIVSLVVSILTLYSMTKIWTQAFWGSPDEDDIPEPISRRARFWVLTPIVGMCLLTIMIGVFAETSARLALDAAEQLLDSSLYIEAVLGPIDVPSEGAPL